MLKKMTCALASLPDVVVVWILMTGPVFHVKAIQLGVISPLSDYQWPIDREEGHTN